MTTSPNARHTGGCLCGAVRYEARGEPAMAGYCCCADCRKASGSGFIPFMGYSRDAVTFTGETRIHLSVSYRGTETARNFCPVCGGLVFGGDRAKDDSFTIYAGSLDEASDFHPAMEIFNRDRPDWVMLPPGLAVFETMPSS
jgi:hypothetical protein